MGRLYKISELAKILNLVDSNNKPLNHIIRYWEKEFKQIKPKLINNQRHYSKEQVEIFKLIKFLIRNQGMTIYGVKNALKSNKKLDYNNFNSLKAEYYKKNLKEKSTKLLDKIKNLKNYGKKNSH